MARHRLDPRIPAALWIGLIYASIPLVRSVREAITARWPAELIGIAVAAVVIGATAVSVLPLRRRQSRLRFADLAWLGGMAAIAVLWISRLTGQPEEAVHFLEYGVLGVLIYRVLAERVTDPTVYGATILVGLLVGTVDEFIQWLVPGRFWDLRDILLNTGAVALVQIAMWRLVARTPTRVGPSSIRLLCRLAAALVLALAVCFAATPQRLARLANHVPLPQRLASGTDAICEYGYRHAVDDLTVFRSRMPLAALSESDNSRSAEVARQLDAARSFRGPSKIIISPVDDPFAYEARVHVFARNRNLHRARKHEPGTVDHRQLMTTAWRQNLILEGFFANTLKESSYGWGPRVRAEVEDAQEPEAFFISRVGAHLITRLSEGQLRCLMVVLFAVLAACDVLFSRRSRQEAQPE